MTLPTALMFPAVEKLPPIVFPTTDKLFNAPTDSNDEYTTLELSVVPIKALAATLDAVTPVS